MSKNKKQNKQITLTKNAVENLRLNTNESASYRYNMAKLGLQDFLQKLSGYFARQIEQNSTSKNDILQDNAQKNSLNDKMLSHVLSIPSYEKLQALIQSLDTCNIESFKLPKICLLDNEILNLAKNGTLRLYDIFQCLQMINFFHVCKKREDITHKYLIEYFQKFVFPKEILDLLKFFTFDKATTQVQSYLKECADGELTNLYKTLENKEKEKRETLYQSLNNNNLQEYLVDRQIHLIDDNAALLVRPGYTKVLSARVIGRSVSGFFYIIPLSLEHIESQIHVLHDKIEERLFYLAKEYSKILREHVHFLRFINSEFDFMDKALSRLNFARNYNYSFVFASQNIKGQNVQILLNEYAHPSLKNPTPLSVQMDRNLLMITGVNAGGKTMLLKSILSALWCAKLCIPMRINSNKSKIPYMRDIHIIAQDPQDSHNDISTFSGRIKEISVFLEKRDFILGIDEIEIGTDSSEAASLYKVILTRLLDNGAKIIVTTHHKHLAALMADNYHTKLLAALYDYEKGKPTFSFIEGIGKSYAMECAKHYGIPESLINEAKQIYGDEANRLDRLIEESHMQITRNKQENLKLQTLIKAKEQKIQELDSAKKELKEKFEKQSLTLKRHYNEAIKEIKMLAKQTQNLNEISLKELEIKEVQGTQEIVKNIHKLLNKAHKNEAKSPKILIESTKKYRAGDAVQYQNKPAKILEYSKHTYTIELQNGVRLKGVQGFELSLLKSQATQQNMVKSYELQADIKATTKLDLHGSTREEALEMLEDFLNHAIMARFSEVLVVHGMGNGILKKMVENFLDNCKFIRGYIQAPPNMGGLGAKVIYLHT